MSAIARSLSECTGATELGNAAGAELMTAELDRTPVRHKKETKSSKKARRGLSCNASVSEQVREDALRCDPMVKVLSAQKVECQRCGYVIKLSDKSRYDASHWNKHKNSCIERAKSFTKDLKAWTESQKAAVASGSGASTTQQKDSTSTRSAARSEHIDDSDSDDEVWGFYPLMNVGDPELSPLCKDYFKQTGRPLREDLLAMRWQNWNWSMIKTPNFAKTAEHEYTAPFVRENPHETCKHR
ncbi:hypothetical protein A0H81_06370 [Grifola frondosa]|uniref:Uncharacterized protein n=1 Tax=Grifola frondosa TaxID=5627 RepID=A0A1C7MC06_GRIFR|nr:hypothetical protein A0H81_06370 [Grifola frondosa]